MSARRAMRVAGTVLACALGIGCGAERELSACNIATETCQEDIYYAIVRLRGDGFDPFEGIPPIRTLTLEEYRKQLLARHKPPKPADPDAKPKIVPWDVALALLGLMKPKTTAGQASVDDAVRHVAAFYSSQDRRVTVIDRGGNRNDRADTTLLAHELVHAFQDNEFTQFDLSTTDGGYAARALTEGEATLYEELVSAEIRRKSPYELDWDDYYRNWMANLRHGLPQQDSPFYAVNWFVYPLGAAVLTDAWLTGGNAGVRHVLSLALDSTHEYLARIEQLDPAPAAPLECLVELPGEDFTRAGLDRFGALQLYAFLAKAGMNEDAAWTTALEWRDDRLFVFFEKETERVVVSWRFRLGSAELARAAADSLPDSAERMIDAEGSDLLVRASTAPELLDGWPGATDCAR